MSTSSPKEIFWQQTKQNKTESKSKDAPRKTHSA
jgi:hypothetical protein